MFLNHNLCRTVALMTESLLHLLPELLRVQNCIEECYILRVFVHVAKYTHVPGSNLRPVWNKTDVVVNSACT